MSLAFSILRRGLLTPKRVAIIDDLTTYTYGKLLFGAWHLAAQIKKHTQNKHVGLMLPPSGAFPVTVFGAWVAGRTPVPLNFMLKPQELAGVIADSGLDTIFTVGKLLDYLGGEEVLPAHIKVVKLEELPRKGPLFGLPVPQMPHRFKQDDLAVLLYTSGTSGQPKGVMLTHGNLKAEVDGLCKATEGMMIDTFFGVLPQFHSFGCTALTLWPLSQGKKVIYAGKFIPKQIHKLIKEHQPNVYCAVPSMYNALLSLKNAEPSDFASLNFAISGGEPLPRSVADQLVKRFELPLYEGYGLTETAPVTNVNLPGNNRPGSVGKTLPGVRNVIVDDDGQVLGPNQDGEILIVGGNVMAGYYNKPAETDAVITTVTLDGQTHRAFKTGDIGRIDDEGYLFITGRKKEMLIVGGENVFPREIEEVLNQHDAVSASAVVGLKDDAKGELPIAFIELTEEAKPTDDTAFDIKPLMQHAREHLAAYKVPKEIRVIDQLPRNPTGKILRRDLKP